MKSAVAVFCWFDKNRIDDLKDGIYLFESRSRAENWIIERLVSDGMVKKHSDFEWEYNGCIYCDCDLLIHEVNTDLGLHEFFNVFEVHKP